MAIAGPVTERDALPRLGLLQTATLLATWLLFAWAYATTPFDERQVYFAGDQALLLQAADDTLHGHPPLVGAQSREGLFHPGPLFVYLLAAVQAITGRREAWSLAVVSVLQAATVPLLGLLTYQLSRSRALAVTLPFLCVLNSTFLLYLRFLWNVSIVTPALALALSLALAAGARRAWTLPALAATLSLIAQAHMGFLPLAIWIGLAAVGRVLLTERPVPVRRLVATLAVLAALWTPVVWDALRHHGGNVAKVIARFSAPAERHPFREVLSTVDALASECLPGGPSTRAALLLASIALLALSGPRRDPDARHRRWFLALLAGSWATFLWSVHTIPEPIQTYYLRPVVVLIAATVIGGAAALVSLVPVGARVPVASLLACAVVLVSIRPAREMRRRFADPTWNEHPLAEYRLLVDALAARTTGGRVRLDFRLGDRGGAEPSFLYLVGRRGLVRSWEPGLPSFRLTLVEATEEPTASPGGAGGGAPPPTRVEATPPASEERWSEVTRTERYRLERLDPGTAASGPHA